MEAYVGVDVYPVDPRFRDLGTSWRWVVSTTPLPLYPRGICPATHSIGDWMDPRTYLDGMKLRFWLWEFEQQSPGHPAIDKFYRLSGCGEPQLNDIRAECQYCNSINCLPSLPEHQHSAHPSIVCTSSIMALKCSRARHPVRHSSPLVWVPGPSRDLVARQWDHSAD
jgi:hypothetical protein